MSKKRKNIINEDDAINTFLSYDFEAVKFNFYQIRIKVPQLGNISFDWYHTRGSLVMCREGQNISLGKERFFNDEETALEILKQLEKHV